MLQINVYNASRWSCFTERLQSYKQVIGSINIGLYKSAVFVLQALFMDHQWIGPQWMDQWMGPQWMDQRINPQ